MKTKMTKQIGIRLSPEHYELLQKAALETGLDASTIARAALLGILDQWKRTKSITFKANITPLQKAQTK